MSEMPAVDRVEPVPAAPPREPVWDVFVAYFAAMVVGLVGIVAVMVVFAVILYASGTGSGDSSQPDIEAWLETHPTSALLLTNIPFQLTIAAVALLWRRPCRGSQREHLGLVSPGFSFGQWVMLLLASGVPLAASLGAASLVPSFMDSSALADTWATMPVGSAVVWVLYIGLAPGICEELFFRGLMMRRFLRRWGAPVSIGISSVLFGIAHVDPPAFMLAVTLGVWLGFVAWRTGSVLPTMATHVLVNASWNIGQITVRQNQTDERIVWTIVGVIGAVSLVCFVMAIRMLLARPAATLPGR